MSTALQRAVLSNVVAINNKFTTVSVTFVPTVERNFYAAIQSALAVAGADTNPVGFIAYNSTAAECRIYTKTGQNATGLRYPSLATLPYYPIAESPAQSLWCWTAADGDLKVACFYN